MITVFGLLCLLGAAPPALVGHPVGAALVRLLFAPICHQIPERSFALGGVPFAICQRCFSIYFGLALGGLLPAALLSLGARYPRAALAVVSLPLVADAALPFAGIWTNTALSRSATGFAFGLMLAGIVVVGLGTMLFRLRTSQGTLP